MEILATVKYVKIRSKKKVTLTRIESCLKKTNYTINKDDLINIIDDLISRDNSKVEGNKTIISY